MLQSVSPLMHWEGILDVINSSPLFWVSICSHQLCADLVWVFLSGSIQILIFFDQVQHNYFAAMGALSGLFARAPPGRGFARHTFASCWSRRT